MHARINPMYSKKPYQKNTKKNARPFVRASPLEKAPSHPRENREVRKENKKEGDTSWGGVASWYDRHLERVGDTYHEKVVYPNLLRLLGDEKGQLQGLKGKHILDLACGQGQFSRLLADRGAFVAGVDLGKELIEIAEKNNTEHKFKVHYYNTASDDLYMLKDKTQDAVVCLLALQNIEKLNETIAEVNRVLKDDGKFYCVLNHPSFRVPRESGWGFDENEKVQYRRVHAYLSESKIKIDMNPGSKTDKKYTVSFHRPLQVYVKALAKHGLAITRLEEWESHKKSEKGPKQQAEDRARKEIPLFMCIETRKI